VTAPTLATQRLVLRPTDPEVDARPLLIMFRGGPENNPWEFDSEEHPARMTAARLRRQLEQAVRGAQGWTWTLLLDDRPVGIFSLFPGEGLDNRGVTYRLAPSEWGRGLMSEAVRAGSDHLLGPAGFTGLEAWVDSRNVRSLGVARAAGYKERGRLPRVYADHIGQTVVLGRAAKEVDPVVFDLAPVLDVTDVATTVRTLGDLLDLHTTYEADGYASLSATGWSGSPGVVLRQQGSRIRPQQVSIDVGVHVDRLVRRARRLGLDVTRGPVEQPWFRRDVWIKLPEGHLLQLSGPSTPEKWAKRRR
jgi:RimJ/RimL family protein N-acetyltransferase